MRLRRLLQIEKDDIYVIGSLKPMFFYQLSNITREFVNACSANDCDFDQAMSTLKKKYHPKEIQEFEERINEIKEKLFVEEEKDEKENLSRKITTLTLNASRKCNLKCSYCYENEEFREMNNNMPFEIAKKAIDAFFTNKLTDWNVIFTGGEPMLNYSLIKDVVKYVADQGLKVNFKIKTNGTLLDDEEKMDFFIKNNILIQLSIDGGKIAHDTHRKYANGKGSFETVNKVIRRLIEKGYEENISISGTLSHQTMEFINDSYANLDSYGVPYDLKPPMANSKPEMVLDKKDFLVFNSAIMKNNNQTKVKSKLLLNNEDKYRCGIGLWNITIDVDGKIYPCYFWCGDEKYVIGALDSFVMPFKLPEELEDLYNRFENSKECTQCFFLATCKKSCHVEKIMSKNSVNECLLPNKQLVLELLYDNIIKNGSYKLLKKL